MITKAIMRARGAILLIVLMLPTKAGAGGVIASPSFETPAFETDWSFAVNGRMGYNRASLGLAGSGDYHLQLLSVYESHVYPGYSVSASQEVQLTGVNAISFHARLDGPFGWAGFTIAEVLIGEDVVWSAAVGGNYFDQTVDVQGYSGQHTLVLRNRVLSEQVNAMSQIAHFDGFQTVGSGQVLPFLFPLLLKQ